MIKMKCKTIYVGIIVLSAFLISDTISIYSPNDGIKTKSYRRDPRIPDPSPNAENQSVIMHHQYSQVASNRPYSQYVTQYNQNKPDDAITSTTTQTTSHHSYQGSSRVYQENDSTNNRLGRTSSKIYEIENNITPYQTECPPGATGQFPYSLDCRRFLNCWKGRGYIQTCAPGTIFNPDTLECDSPQKVSCHGFGKYEQNENGKFERLQERPSIPRTVITTSANQDDLVKCHPSTSGVEPHPFDCTKFLNCAHGLTYVQSCAPGTLFNDLTSTCDYPNKVDCGTRSLNLDVRETITNEHHQQNRDGRFERLEESASIPRTVITTTSIQNQDALVKCHPSTSGVQPHPFDCTKFLNCANGLTHIQNCGPGTAFNELTGVCDYPYNVDCGTRKLNIDVTSTSNDRFEARRPYNEHVISSPATQTIHRVTTSYSSNPTSYGSSNLQNQRQDHYYTDHEHTENCNHNSHSRYSQQNSQNSGQSTWTKSNVVYTQSPGTVPVVSPVKWGSNSGYNPTRPGGWSYTRNVTTVNSQTSSNSKPDVGVVYPSTDNENVQRPSASGSQFTVVYPEQEEENGQQLLKPDWNNFETEPSSQEDDNQRPVNPNWTSGGSNSQTTTIYSQSQIRQPGYGKQYQGSSYVPQPSGPIYIRQPTQPSGTSYSSTTTTHYVPSYGSSSMYNRQTPYGSAGYPSYQQRYNQTWTSATTTTTTQQQNRPQTSYGNVYIQQATVKDIPKSEQSHLNHEGSRKGSSYTDDQTNYLDHHPHHHHHHRHFGHNREFHQNNPHVPSPFEPASSNIESGRHHNHHFGHSKEFHQNNPHMPNPFDDSSSNTNRPIRRGYTQFPQPTPLPDTATLPSPDVRAKIDIRSTVPIVNPSRYPDRRQVNYPKASTTTTTVAPDYATECQFDCENGKCIKDFEVCDGVNNCGNRLDEKYCDHLGYEVRLSNEEGKNNMGRVEVKILNKWGYVCDDKFGMRDADVLCRELGFPLGAVEVRGNSFYPPHSDMIDENNDVLFVMDEVDCTGNETSLKECDFKGWGVHDCTAEEVVGVVCKVPVMKCPHDYWLCSTSKECIPPAFVCDNTPDCADKSDEAENICNSTIQYRLADGDGRLEGRVEVKYRGKWGSICDDDFTETEAQVVCKSLGFYGKAQIIKNAFGPGTGPIWLDQVSCLGNETSLDKCIHWEWGEHNCNHSEDVSVRCSIGSLQPTIDNSNYNGVKGRSSLAVPRQRLEPIDSEEYDNYMYQMERSSKMLGNQQDGNKCGHFSANLKDELDFPEEKMQRVIQGTKARRGRHPWQATIRTKGRGGKSTHWCGAVLISKRHLLTAAHCLNGYEKGAYFVRLGDHYANIAESSETDIFIENWYIHEDFRKGSHMNNDIALIVLKSPVQFNDYIQPICLPSKHASYKDGKTCTISGWGSIQSGLSTPSNYLRAAQVPIIDDSVCKRPIVYGNTITEGMFCAGYLDEGTDACDGDSGGPLVCTDNGFETLYGIISWGQHCGYANKPGVYVKIAHYVDWIHNKINFLIQSRRNNN